MGSDSVCLCRAGRAVRPAWAASLCGGQSRGGARSSAAWTRCAPAPRRSALQARRRSSWTPSNTQPCLFGRRTGGGRCINRGRRAGRVPRRASRWGSWRRCVMPARWISRPALRWSAAAAELMAAAANGLPSFMAAVLKLDAAAGRGTSAKPLTQVWPVNYNCPGQVAVAGEAAAQERLRTGRARGGRPRPDPLKVSAAHSTRP